MSARTLWLLRHAKTVADPPDGGSDFDRILAPRGRRDATALSHLFGTDGRGLGLGEVPLPQIALVSPAARAVATADLALAELAAPPARHLVPDFYSAGPEEVLDHLRTLPDDVTSVMVVGHNPTFEALVGAVAESPPSSLTGGFATCGLAVFEIPVPEWAEIAPHTAAVLGVFVPPF